MTLQIKLKLYKSERFQQPSPLVLGKLSPLSLACVKEEIHREVPWLRDQET